jgi:HlyD family secretion protein
MQFRAFVLLTAAVCLLLTCSCRDEGRREERQEQDPFHRTFAETGELRAVRNTAISMPWYHFGYGQPQITFLEKEGTVVSKGQVVAEIETSGILKVLENKKADLAIAQADLNKMKVDHESKMEQLKGEFQSALSAFQLAQIDTQRVRYESDTRKEIAQLDLERSLITLRKIKEKIESSRRIQEQELKIQLAKNARTRSTIKTAEKTIENFSLRAPADGMIVYSRNWHTREKVSVGDQLFPGQSIITLPDLSQMKIQTSVNEIDIQKIDLGQKVVVRLDAFPKIAFDGVITAISHICHRKDRNSNIKVFDVEALLEKKHRILKPGMTVSCEFLLRKQS